MPRHGMACLGMPRHGMAWHAMPYLGMPRHAMRPGGRVGGNPEIRKKTQYVQNHAKTSRSEIWRRLVVVRGHQLCYGPDFSLF